MTQSPTRPTKLYNIGTHFKTKQYSLKRKRKSLYIQWGKTARMQLKYELKHDTDALQEGNITAFVLNCPPIAPKPETHRKE